MKTFLLIFSLMILASCGDKVSFNKKEWDVVCNKKEQVMVEKCVSKIETLQNLIIPTAYAQDFATTMAIHTMNTTMMMNAANNDSCKKKMVAETQCTEYTIKKKHLAKLTKEDVLKKLTPEERKVLLESTH